MPRACSDRIFSSIHGNLITNGELELMAKARMPLCFTPTADTQGTPADVVRRALDRGVEVVFGCDVPCSIASDPLGQLRVMFNVQGFLDGAMERSFSTVVGRRPAVRPGLPLLTPRRLHRDRDHRDGARAGPRRPHRLADARQAGRHRADPQGPVRRFRRPTTPARMSFSRRARATSTRCWSTAKSA